MLQNSIVWMFGNAEIPLSQIFLFRKNAIGLINLMPLVPGHVLVCSRRKVKRLQELNDIETFDLWSSAQEVQNAMEEYYNRTYQLVVQDGRDAGQTMEHVHIHVFPKLNSETEIKIGESERRTPRDPTDMAEEAKKYRDLFKETESNQ